MKWKESKRIDHVITGLCCICFRAHEWNQCLEKRKKNVNLKFTSFSYIHVASPVLSTTAENEFKCLWGRNSSSAKCVEIRASKGCSRSFRFCCLKSRHQWNFCIATQFLYLLCKQSLIRWAALAMAHFQVEVITKNVR